MSPTKRFSVNQGWKVLFADMGIDPKEVLLRANLPGDLFARRDAYLSTLEYFRLWDALEAMFLDPCFALKLVENLTADFFDPPLFAAYCSPNLNVALERREDLAQHYLARSPVSFGEIAFLLGFQDSNSFIRAFNGWTGQTPGQYRRALH